MANVTFKGSPITLKGNEAKVGNSAPDFTVFAPDLSPVKLSDFKGKIKIITAFPSIDTPICALQARTFNKRVTELGKDVVVVAISCDLPFALGRFCAAENIEKVYATSDHNQLDFANKYGFLIADLRLLARGTVVVDKNDTIRYVEYVSEVTTEPNYQGALDCVKTLL
ncbi:MAG: thiol peroxidase [Bacteroidales bacterium]